VSGKCRPNCASGEQRDRVNDARATDRQFWKLGDIFHSAPAVVSPPYSKALASTGWENQALMSLFASWGTSAPGTPLNPSGSPDAYDTYVSSGASRPPVILVGANDGMLHAFCAANPGGGCTPGTELWGFIPPDLLPRLRDSLFKHQYFVDGNVMIRDVWVDENKNGKKESTEFHTMAVITERSGGHAFTGLDVTSTSADRPVYRWTFPQLCTPESRVMGETWSDFPPRPPPIGPVKLALPYSGSPADPLGRKWEERWVVGLNGGHDSTLVRGRAAFINDVWTGDVLWSLTDADLRTNGKNDLGYGDKVSLFPVPATIGLVDAGNGGTAYGDGDGIFDTATFGDMGGNLWLVRLSDPGVLDSTTKRVTNWFAARAFEEQRRTDNAQNIAGRSPFFFMTGNAFDIEMGYLRTYAGSGNRERLLDQQQTCSADNVLGCCQAGCTVVSSSTPTSSAVDNFGSCSVAQSFSCTAGVLTSTPATGTCGSSYTCDQNKVTVTLNMNCGAGALPPIVATLTCDNSGLCSQVQPFGTSKINLTSGTTLPKSHMYGVWAYGGSSSRTFNTMAGAKTFDAHRSTDVTYSAAACAPASGCKLVNTEGASYSRTNGVTCTPTGSPCQASTLDPGWMYEYGVKCPLQSCSPPPPWTDEKTATAAWPAWGCTVFSTTRPTGGSSGGDPCTSNVGAPTAYAYALDYLTGTPSSVCGYFSGNNGYAAYSRNSSAPPQNPMPRVVITADGQVKMTTLQMDAGSQPDSNDMGYRDSLVNLLYYLEVPRDLHTCRHADPKTCK
jgi:type IV pilus assembly protein PilY1